MSENDRLKREIRIEITKREELHRSLQTQRPALESLQAENARLTNIKSMDDNIIARRDRKIAELKAELDVERTKRVAADQRAAEAEKTTQEGEESRGREIQAAVEEAKHASVHAEILRTSHQQLSREYRQRIATTTKSLRELNEDKEEDRKRLAKLDVVNGMMKKEAERMRRLFADMSALVAKMEEEQRNKVEELESECKRIRDEARRGERENREVKSQMVEVVGRMRWVMQLEKNAVGRIDSPPPSPEDYNRKGTEE